MINERLIELRKKLGFNQTEFGKYFDLKQTAISQYEKGINELKSSFLEKVFKEFNVNINWLLTGQGEMFFNNKNLNNNFELQDEKIKSIITKLNDIQDDELLDYIDAKILEITKRYKLKF